jgi:hypothetical protein
MAERTTFRARPGLAAPPAAAAPCASRARWGCRVAYASLHHPVEIRQAARVPRDLPFDVTVGANVVLMCWGVMPSGMLRHPVLLSADQS